MLRHAGSGFQYLKALKVLHLDVDCLKGQLESNSLEVLKVACQKFNQSDAKFGTFGYLPQLKTVELRAPLNTHMVSTRPSLHLWSPKLDCVVKRQLGCSYPNSHKQVQAGYQEVDCVQTPSMPSFNAASWCVYKVDFGSVGFLLTGGGGGGGGFQVVYSFKWTLGFHTSSTVLSFIVGEFCRRCLLWHTDSAVSAM